MERKMFLLLTCPTRGAGGRPPHPTPDRVSQVSWHAKRGDQFRVTSTRGKWNQSSVDALPPRVDESLPWRFFFSSLERPLMVIFVTVMGTTGLSSTVFTLEIASTTS